MVGAGGEGDEAAVRVYLDIVQPGTALQRAQVRGAVRLEKPTDELREAVEIPLVLHGGSDNPDSEIEQACLIGISKINISSDIKKAFYQKCREVLENKNLREPNEIYPPCIEEMKKVMRHKFRLFHADGKAELY